MTSSRAQLGADGEELACRHLRAEGYVIEERNARTRYGELDIVAREGRTLVFVEVKTGRAGARTGPERPILAVGAGKQRRLRRLASAWMAERRPSFTAVRIDVIGVLLPAGDGTDAVIEHLRAAV